MKESLIVLDELGSECFTRESMDVIHVPSVSIMNRMPMPIVAMRSCLRAEDVNTALASAPGGPISESTHSYNEVKRSVFDLR